MSLRATQGVRARVSLTPLLLVHVKPWDGRRKTHEEVVAKLRLVLGHVIGWVLVRLERRTFGAGFAIAMQLLVSGDIYHVS